LNRRGWGWVLGDRFLLLVHHESFTPQQRFLSGSRLFVSLRPLGAGDHETGGSGDV
jgi:hypothetical protein